MKKFIAIVLAIVTLASLCFVFSSCGKTAECFGCGEEYKARKMRKEEFWGETVYMCDECFDFLFGDGE